MDLIREARLRAGISQRELADRIGTSQPAVARWENGTVDPTFEALKTAIRACDFELKIDVQPADAGLDTLLARQLELTPAQRIASLQRAIGLRRRLDANRNAA